jgi:hypothetical protein
MESLSRFVDQQKMPDLSSQLILGMRQQHPNQCSVMTLEFPAYAANYSG